jgi:hypothetical protein
MAPRWPTRQGRAKFSRRRGSGALYCRHVVVHERTIAACGALMGVALVGGVVAWRLAGATLRADVETICSAELRSGLTMRHEMPALGDWVRGHLATPEGNELLATLGDLSMADRAAHLRALAAAQGVTPCPMAASYEALVAEGDARADLQRLCSYVTFPDLAQGDDAERLAVLEAWIAEDAKDPRTKALAGPLRAAESPADRARVLRAASREIGILTCDVAKVLESPPPASDASTAPDASAAD